MRCFHRLISCLYEQYYCPALHHNAMLLYIARGFVSHLHNCIAISMFFNQSISVEVAIGRVASRSLCSSPILSSNATTQSFPRGMRR